MKTQQFTINGHAIEAATVREAVSLAIDHMRNNVRGQGRAWLRTMPVNGVKRGQTIQKSVSICQIDRKLVAPDQRLFVWVKKWTAGISTGKHSLVTVPFELEIKNRSV